MIATCFTMKRRSMARSLALAVAVGFAFVSSNTSAEAGPAASELCLVAVKNGRPTDADLNAAWRMIFGVVFLPGVPRPIIYPANRRGVWTIDDNDTFSPFGGEFPAFLPDRFAYDPATNEVVGVNVPRGLFRYDPIQAQFVNLAPADGDSLDQPFDVRFVPRLNGFVVVDPNGLFLLDRNMRLMPLRTDIPAGNALDTPFDLPEISAFLVHIGPSRVPDPGNRWFLRFDDGRVVLIATLERWDFVEEARVTAGGSIDVKTHWNRFSVKLPTQAPDGSYEEPADALVVRPRPAPSAKPSPYGIRVEARSIGKVFFWSPKGLWEKSEDDAVRIALPFDEMAHPIVDVAEFPALERLVVFSDAGIFTIAGDGRIADVPGTRNIVRGLGASKGVIPGRDAMIVLGMDGLFLLSNADASDRHRCLS